MIEISWVLALSISLFCIGLFGLLSRRNLLFMLISLEIMLNGVALIFVAASSLHGNIDGQLMYLFILTLAASEVAVGLALVIHVYRQQKDLDVDKLNKLRG
ncbi:NADH-quinone oxidoreductase subunit NuoK [Shewanella eurypsychrophilus]|uniref:NADH-quinone oxidoreductase subunit K n=1 Tax=Shewanella eurypsychrophilus TaxID=2593656 RepID=A0ABX6VDG0_9GAMM|nr:MULTISPECIES: NADH-quinone oxidoreductase subunit NuoK [Shewanella]QFU23317.1 NADH-quinone oxidoreductase subunit NuoK [Shewanella sp. YLB-09]QPG58546.1 NADH-quinone oxidoreductase subunit NuoK [Shewanella eurypsychrophilus]